MAMLDLEQNLGKAMLAMARAEGHRPKVASLSKANIGQKYAEFENRKTKMMHDLLRRQGDTCVKELAAHAGIAKNTAGLYIRRGVASGLVVATKKGHSMFYRLAA